MNLDDALEKVTAWTPKKLAFPPTPQMVHASHAVAKRLRDVSASVDLIDMNDLRNRLFQARTTGTWKTISSRDWRYAAECLGMGQRPLIEDRGFLAEYLGQLRGQRSRLAVSRLIRFYLIYFEPSHVGIHTIATFLKEIVTKWRWSWAERQAKFGIFDVPTAPRMLADHLMQSVDDPPDAVMEATGFGGSLYGSRLAGHAYMLAAQHVYGLLIQTPSSLPVIKRFVSWGMIDKRFAFESTPRAIARMAESLLLPWVDRVAPDDVRAFIESHLLSLLHDLRIDRSRWLDVDEKAQRVMRRWLTRASLEQFLDVVDRTAQSHMWAARRQFWSAYYERKFMLEAWVAFARDGSNFAKRLAAEKENPAIGNFGALASGGVSRNHAVLIMQIGDLVVADWSHNGKCHIWLPDNVNAPKLYRRTYHRDELVNGSDFNKVHNGDWQNDVHEFIRRNTGITITARRYI
ncbi:MAG: EH signature domain-containing protein [Magnetococcus sp. YQC-5]